MSLEDLITIRDRMRREYLERAGAVDKKVTQFHASLPRNLWHLERMRITPEQSELAFDRACLAIQAGTSAGSLVATPK